MKQAYIDASVWITRFEGLPAYREKIDAELEQLAQEGFSFVASEAVALEVLLKPYKHDDITMLEKYRTVFLSCGGLLPAYPQIFSEALEISRREGLKSMDAVHVALALHHKCDCLISADKHFKEVSVIPTIWLELPKIA